GVTTKKKIIARMIGVVIKDIHFASVIHQRLGKTSALGKRSPRMASAEPTPSRPIANSPQRPSQRRRPPIKIAISPTSNPNSRSARKEVFEVLCCDHMLFYLRR